ncbi:uncharacterized protein LOC124388724 [Silurus meridionalis]|uniref:uncharacterized protein LOC124388724 n=1 Tax=Silurus meridionalis TaxID=175797 RepID=UPI001EEC12A2|nr:uncharacterized protein LOC124388724 [Silurus meridionalis]
MFQEDLENCSVQKIKNEAEGSGEHESIPATGTSNTCPSSSAKTDHKNPTTEKRHRSSSTSLEDGPTSAKRTNDGLESEERNENDAPSTQERNGSGENHAGVWNFTIYNNNNIIIIKYNSEFKNISSFLQSNYLKKEEQNSSQNEKRSSLATDLKTFLKLLDEKRAKSIYKKDINTQHAFFLLKKKSESMPNSMDKISGPYFRESEKHSEDLIIEELEKNKIDDESEIWIYTLNNPCIGRKNHLPCMYNLIKFSERHSNIKMNIVFSKYYIFINIDRKCDVKGNKTEKDKSVGVSEEKLQYNQNVVLTFLEKVQGLYPNLKFFHSPDNLVNEE